MQQNYIQILIPLILIPVLLVIYFRLRLKRLATYKSEKLGNIAVIEKYDKERILTINYYAQGVSIEKGSIKKSYWYKVADLTVKHCKSIKNPKILMLGLGANTISNLIDKLNPKIHQTIVEYDENIIQACKEYFGLDKLKNFTLVHGDVYKLIGKWSSLRVRRDVGRGNLSFDVIIVDIFTGNAPFVDVKSNEAEFIQKVLKVLKKDGVIIFNRPAHKEDLREGSKKLQEYLSRYLKNTDLLDIKDPRGYRNNIITATQKK